MNRNYLLAAIPAIGCASAVSLCSDPAQAHGAPKALDDVKTVAGFKVRLVAVADADLGVQGHRLADHAWWPNGLPYEGPETRLSPQSVADVPGARLPRRVVFELEQPVTAAETAANGPAMLVNTSIDVFSYLPKGGLRNSDAVQDPGTSGPLKIQVYHGVARDSAGNLVLAAPTSVAMEFGTQSKHPQPVCLGIAQGAFKVVARGSASVAGLAVNQTAILASGPWGRIEATHLPMPQVVSAPPRTHRLRLLGGEFPPKTERKALFYDSNGSLVASCGDGPNNPGYLWLFMARAGLVDIATYEIQERPYDVVQFNGVHFNAPRVRGYSGDQGLEHALDSSIGKVLGVLKWANDGPWSGSLLYAADGTRWLDPRPELASYEYGQFDPWNHRPDDRRTILLHLSNELSASTITACEVYAADSPDGPRKERLAGRNEMQFQAPITSISCGPTTRPYMRLEVSVGDGAWRTLETVAVSDRMLQMANAGAPGTRILELFIDDDGAIRIWKDEANPVDSQSRWRPGEQRIRAIAHLRDGGTVEVNFNVNGFWGSPPHEKRYRGFDYARQTNGAQLQAASKGLEMNDIASFELQVQELKPPVTISVHSPVN